MMSSSGSRHRSVKVLETRYPSSSSGGAKKATRPGGVVSRKNSAVVGGDQLPARSSDRMRRNHSPSSSAVKLALRAPIACSGIGTGASASRVHSYAYPTIPEASGGGSQVNVAVDDALRRPSWKFPPATIGGLAR